MNDSNVQLTDDIDYKQKITQLTTFTMNDKLIAFAKNLTYINKVK